MKVYLICSKRNVDSKLCLRATEVDEISAIIKLIEIVKMDRKSYLDRGVDPNISVKHDGDKFKMCINMYSDLYDRYINVTYSYIEYEIPDNLFD